MAERYQKVFSLEGIHYNEACPVLVHDGAITKDTESGKIFLQMKMENCSSEGKSIKAVTVGFDLFDAYGNSVSRDFQYDYLDLNCKSGEVFANNVPVFITDSSARSFTFTVSKILFADGSEWQDNGIEWAVYPKPVSIEKSGLDSVQINQLKRETRNKAAFAYNDCGKLWYCTCGKVNTADKDSCACLLKKDFLSTITPEYLTNNAVYSDALAKSEAKKFDEAIRLFDMIKGWRDADERKLQCEAAIKTKRKKKKNRRIGCLASIAGTVAAIILLVTVGIPAIVYGIGNSCLEKGEYQTATLMFTFLGAAGYKDSEEKFAESTLYYIKEEYHNNDEYVAEVDISSLFNDFEGLNFDTVQETAYNWAVKQSKEGDFFFAGLIFGYIKDYKDSSVLMQQCNDAMIAVAEPGDYICLGAIDQTHLFDGKETVAWKVLAKEENRIFVVAERALLRMPFSDDSSQVSWADSSLRKYLNNDFLNEVFTEAERNRILTMSLSDSFTYAGEEFSAPSTQDKVFLLSYAEAETYLTAVDKKCIATHVASDNKDENQIFTASYMLRSPGFVIDYNAEVSKWNSFYTSELYVRPAMWISIG